MFFPFVQTMVVILKKQFFLSLAFIVLMSLVLTACAILPVSNKTTPTSTTEIINSPTPSPVGSTENPLVLAFINPENDSAIVSAGNGLGEDFAAFSLLNTKSVYYPNYKELMDDLEVGKAHVLWIPPATYINAHERGLANISLLANHFGVYSYGTRFLANQASGFTMGYDPITGINRFNR